MKIATMARKSIYLGSISSLSYLAVYVARNSLGAVSPQMQEWQVTTTERIGVLSTLFFFAYGIGQLINGAIGDKIKAKYMISFGLVLAGISHFLFSYCIRTPLAAYIIYACDGFFLSGIYGPITKTVSENVELKYATRCSLGFTCASFLGSPIAGLLAAFLVWSNVIKFSGSLLVVMGIISFAVFSAFEKRGIIRYGQYARRESMRKTLSLLVKREIITFSVIAVLTGVIRTTVIFWLPTYLSQHLGFTSETSSLLFTGTTLFISFSAFLTIIVYEKLEHNIHRSLLVFFAAAALCFLGAYLSHNTVLNILFLVLAIFFSNCSDAVLWSCYCPSLCDTGVVSGAVGYLDFVSYMAAAVSSTVFANAVNGIGWSGLVFVWFGLMVLGVAVSVPYKRLRPRF